MGQRTSNFIDPDSSTLSKTEIEDLKKQSKLLSESSDEKVLKDEFADIDKQLDSGDPPLSTHEARKDKDKGLFYEYVKPDNAERKCSRIYDDIRSAYDVGPTGDSPKITTLNTDAISFMIQPNMHRSIIEIGHFTALKMIRNFEEFDKIELLQNHIFDLKEKEIEDDASEKDFRTIIYDDIPAVQLVKNITILKQDTSTHTNDIADDDFTSMNDVKDDASASLNDVDETILEDFQLDVVDFENQSCKDEEVITNSIEVSDDSTEQDDDSSINDQSTVIKDSEDVELLKLKERLNVLEFERDEIRLRLKVAEERCQAYETESKCLEATLGSMEEKLRKIVTELNGELKKSKELEEQLSQTLRNSNGATELSTATIETLESTS